MSTVGSNQGRVHAASASPELGLIGRAVAKPVLRFTDWAALPTIGFGRRHQNRLSRRPRSRGRRPPPDLLSEDHRRIAADVHDLIMQDLALALATARALVEDPELTPRAGVMVEATERALAGARDVVDGLVKQNRKPIAEAVEAGIRAAARDASVSFDAEGVMSSTQADQPTHDALVHIGREAVTNAIKYAGADADIEVVFEHDEEWRLTVRDKGFGFDLSSTPAGFGLESMRAHARELGGSLRVMSVVGEGSTVEAILP